MYFLVGSVARKTRQNVIRVCLQFGYMNISHNFGGAQVRSCILRND